jgi:hypothetical protein
MPNVDVNWQSFNSPNKIHGKTEKNPHLSFGCTSLAKVEIWHHIIKNKRGAYQSPIFLLSTYIQDFLLAQGVTKVKPFKKLS